MKQELIVKSNTLLQHPLYKTSMELKIFSKIILAIRENPQEEIFTFQVKNLIEDFNCHEDDYERLKKVAKGMFGKSVDINTSTDNVCDLVVIFRRITIDKKGLITFRIEEDIKPFILDLTSNFTQYYFENIARLKSNFSIRIYELLKQYEKIGNRKIAILSLRHFLNVSDDKYKLYGDFKKKTILIAQKELKDKTDICFDFEENKIGNKVVEINFIIMRNKKDILLTLDFEKEPEKESVKQIEDKTVLTDDQKNLKLKLINNYKISEKTANDLVLSVKMEQIESNITYAENEYKNNKISKNLGGYLLDAIKNNYANNISLFELETKKKATDKENEKRKKEMEEKKEALRSKLSQEFGRTEKERFINLLNDKEKDDLKNEILEEISLDDFSLNSFKTKGLTSPAVGVYIIRRIPNFEKRREQFIAEKLKEAGLS
jgi:plasmid replication initiation protein